MQTLNSETILPEFHVWLHCRWTLWPLTSCLLKRFSVWSNGFCEDTFIIALCSHLIFLCLSVSSLRRENNSSSISVKMMWCRLKEVPRIVPGSQQGRPLYCHMGPHAPHTCSLLSCQLPGSAFVFWMGQLADSRVWLHITRSPSATVSLEGSTEFPGTRSLLCKAQLVA